MAELRGTHATARLTVAQQRVTTAMAGPTGMVVVWVDKVTNGIRNRAILYCPVDTGRLRASIVATKAVMSGVLVIGSVGTDVEYAAAVHNGLSKRTVTVKAHTSRSRLGTTYQVSEHTRAQAARVGRPFLTRASEEELRMRGALR